MAHHYLLSAGGTGGGVYPALAACNALRSLPDAPTLHFIGGRGGMEEKLVAKSGDLFASYDAIEAGPLHGVPIPRRIVSAFKLAIGTLQTIRLIGNYKPKAALLTGGFVTFPVAVACWLRRIPIAIYLPDIEPGQAIKATAALAKVVFVTTHESDRYFKPGKTIETGYPLRADVLSAERATGIAHFQLDPDRQTLLVFGGSRGAKSINQATIAGLPELLAAGLQIIHISGELDWPTVQAAHHDLPIDLQAHYHIFPYLHEDMGLALAAADLVVSRAGASTLGEFPQFGLPAILVPYPYAWRYQKVNADWLESRGAGVRLNDELMDAELVPLILDLTRDPGKLAAMREASRKLARPDGALNIARGLTTL